jgi:cephalosporin-C deacetylase-like acetyl esterase
MDFFIDTVEVELIKRKYKLFELQVFFIFFNGTRNRRIKILQ